MMPETEVVEIPLYSPDEILEQVEKALDSDNLPAVAEMLNEQYASDLSDMLERIEEPDIMYNVFLLLAPDIAAEVLDEGGRYLTRSILKRMPTERVVSLFNRLPMDDIVEILTDEIPERADEILDKLLPATAKDIREMMVYPEESAGRLMTRKYVRVNEDMTAEEVIQHMRKIDSKVETVTNAYVLDPAWRLIGVISLRETLMQPPKRQVIDFMETQVISVTPDVDQEEAARTIARYDFLALPVVTKDMKMLGIITVDDAIDVLAQENTEDMMRFGAVGGEANDQPYFTVPIHTVVRSRITWLVLLFAADFITNGVLRSFEDQLAMVVALSFYIPLLIGTGGNTGSQTVSMIIRGMAVGDIGSRDVFRVIKRELVAGLLLGMLMGGLGFIRSYLQDGSAMPNLPFVIGISMMTIVIWANLIGSVIPIVTKRLGIDPAVISAPLISTTVDATGLFIYLSIASTLLNLA